MGYLIVEDEVRMLELLRRGLEERGCDVTTAMDGICGLELATAFDYNAILLDIGLPHRDGYGMIRMLRERGRQTPVLVLTARDGEDDIIRGLELGADDYMTKPFSFLELVARLQSITRPMREDGISRIETGDLVVDPLRRLVTRDGVVIELTRSEFSLLMSLARNQGRCVPRQKLMDGVWGPHQDVAPGALDVLVNALRNKLDVPNKRKLIQTVRGSGYVLNGLPNASGRQL